MTQSLGSLSIVSILEEMYETTILQHYLIMDADRLGHGRDGYVQHENKDRKAIGAYTYKAEVYGKYKQLVHPKLLASFSENLENEESLEWETVYQK